jgi:hypothetical protein
MNIINNKLEILRRKVNVTSTKTQYKRMFLLDISVSMLGEKLDTARVVLDDYIKNGDGLIVFGDTAYHVNYSQLKHLIVDGNTAMLPAIVEALKFQPSELILITDGQANEGGSPMDIINFVSRISGVVINTISIGYDADKALLETIAEMTNGKFNHEDEINKLKDTIKMLCSPEMAIAL